MARGLSNKPRLTRERAHESRALRDEREILPFAPLREITMRFRSLILSILPPVVEASDQLQFTLPACASAGRRGAAARCHYYYSRLHRSPSPRLLLNDRARALESLYPRCVTAAHNHYRVESSLERNKCARSRSRCVRSAPCRRMPKFTMVKMSTRHLKQITGFPAGQSKTSFDRPNIIYAKEYKYLIANCDDVSSCV